MNPNYKILVGTYETGEWTQDYARLFVKGELVGWETITNIHNTFEEERELVIKKMINKYENAQARKLARAAQGMS